MVGRAGPPSTSTAPTKKFAELAKVSITPSPRRHHVGLDVSEPARGIESANAVADVAAIQRFPGLLRQQLQQMVAVSVGHAGNLNRLHRLALISGDRPDGRRLVLPAGVRRSTERAGRRRVQAEAATLGFCPAEPVACAAAPDGRTADHSRIIAVRIVAHRLGKQLSLSLGPGVN